MTDIAELTWIQIIMALIIGAALCLIYLALLWKTLQALPNVKNKGNILFFSAIVRLFLLIFVAVYFSNENGARFLLIFIGFFITRVIVLRYTKAKLFKTVAIAAKGHKE